jgi:cyclopropane fatty-acyl-phospholipid synthase-like methyltransferase
MAIYAGQDFFTPGAADTIDLISRTFGLDERSRVLEVAYGSGEGACRLAERHGCSVLGVDVHPLAKFTAQKTSARRVSDRVSFAIGDGGLLPVRDGAFDAAICIGAPSIVGTERCLAAMRHALRLGGMIAVSDWVWRVGEVPAEAVIEGIDLRLLTLDAYADLIRAAGFEIVSAEALPRSAWDNYYEPIRKNLAAIRVEHPGAPMGQIDDELRIWDSGLGPAWWVYAVFVARAG